MKYATMKTFLIIFLALTVNGFATPYYVDQNATGNGSGSSWTNASKTVSGLPWSSIQGGDTVSVSGGTDSTVYSAGIDGTSGINYIPPKTAVGSPIVFTKGWEAGHNGNVYFTQTESPMRGYSFSMNDCHNIKLTGLIFTSGMSAGVYNWYSCLSMNYCSNIIVDKCTVISNGSTTGMYLAYCDSLTITHNTITVTSNNMTNDADNIDIALGNGGHTITNNVFYNYSYNAIPHNDLIQTIHTGGTSNLQTVIANNFFYSAVTYGAGCLFISESLGERYLVYNNIFVTHIAPSYAGIYALRNDATKHLSIRAYNNTFVNSSNTHNGEPIEFASAIDTLIFKNNIVANDSASPVMMKFVSIADNVNYKQIDFNQYYSSVGNSAYWVTYTNHGVSLSEWQALGYDAHSSIGKPTFVNDVGSTASDYALQTGSAGIDAGTPISIFDTDLEGTLRPQGAGWDMGAFEYIQPIPPIGSVGSVIIQLGKKGLQSFRINSR
jgi:hypothetical protein